MFLHLKTHASLKLPSVFALKRIRNKNSYRLIQEDSKAVL